MLRKRRDVGRRRFTCCDILVAAMVICRRAKREAASAGSRLPRQSQAQQIFAPNSMHEARCERGSTLYVTLSPARYSHTGQAQVLAVQIALFVAHAGERFGVALSSQGRGERGRCALDEPYFCPRLLGSKGLAQYQAQ